MPNDSFLLWLLAGAFLWLTLGFGGAFLRLSNIITTSKYYILHTITMLTIAVWVGLLLVGMLYFDQRNGLTFLLTAGLCYIIYDLLKAAANSWKRAKNPN